MFALRKKLPGELILLELHTAYQQTFLDWDRSAEDSIQSRFQLIHILKSLLGRLGHGDEYDSLKDRLSWILCHDSGKRGRIFENVLV
jgi:hypothetical protein